MRFENWPSRLYAEVEAASERPFSWGSFDCALWCCDAVLAMTGVDHGAGFRGKYKTEPGAARAMAKAGGLAAIATAALGESIAPLAAQRGDVALIDRAGVASLGICLGHQVAVPTLPVGLALLPLSEAICAWRV